MIDDSTSVQKYVESLKFPILRPGKCEYEDGSISDELREVTRWPLPIGRWSISRNGTYGWVEILWVNEGLRCGGESWNEQKIHLLYIDSEEKIFDVVVVDFSWMRQAIEHPSDAPVLANMLKTSGLIKESPINPHH